MLIRLFALLWIILCSVAANAANGGLPELTVEYAADRLIETEDGAFTGRVFVAGEKHRSEINMGGMESVTILRLDRRLGWMLMPAQRMYRELDLAEARRHAGTGPQEDVQIDPVGSETIEGFETTKYRLVLKDGSAGGFMWVTAAGVPVKMDLLQKEGRRKARVTITLRNLEIGPQDPKLFELPEGYGAMPGGNLFGNGALRGLMPGVPGLRRN